MVETPAVMNSTKPRRRFHHRRVEGRGHARVHLTERWSDVIPYRWLLTSIVLIVSLVNVALTSADGVAELDLNGDERHRTVQFQSRDRLPRMSDDDDSFEDNPGEFSVQWFLSSSVILRPPGNEETRGIESTKHRPWVALFEENFTMFKAIGEFEW